MLRTAFNTTLVPLISVLLVVGLSSCGQSHTHAEGEDHEHGPETHTHAEPQVADTAGTYVDTTSTFFGDSDHEHGPDTHTHEEGEHEHGEDTHTHDPSVGHQ